MSAVAIYDQELSLPPSLIPPRPGASLAEWNAYRIAAKKAGVYRTAMTVARVRLGPPPPPKVSKVAAAKVEIESVTPPPKEWLFEPPMPFVEYQEPVRYRSFGPSVKSIVKACARAFNLPASEIPSRRRTPEAALCRHVAMYLTKQLTSHSLKEIGLYVAGRDHTTAIFAVSKIARMVLEDPGFAKRIQEIERKILQSTASL